ncbi:hypothetical protein CEXT_257921, partial [Caerostris extrusa]
PLANTRYFDDKISGYNSLINHTNCQRIEGPLCGAFRMSVRPFEPFRSTLHPLSLFRDLYDWGGLVLSPSLSPDLRNRDTPFGSPLTREGYDRVDFGSHF